MTHQTYASHVQHGSWIWLNENILLHPNTCIHKSLQIISQYIYYLTLSYKKQIVTTCWLWTWLGIIFVPASHSWVSNSAEETGTLTNSWEYSCMITRVNWQAVVDLAVSWVIFRSRHTKTSIILVHRPYHPRQFIY